MTERTWEPRQPRLLNRPRCPAIVQLGKRRDGNDGKRICCVRQYALQRRCGPRADVPFTKRATMCFPLGVASCWLREEMSMSMSMSTSKKCHLSKDGSSGHISALCRSLTQYGIAHTTTVSAKRGRLVDEPALTQHIASHHITSHCTLHTAQQLQLSA